MDITVLKFDERGLIPAVAQDANTLEVLMLAYMNREALEKTLSSSKAHYWSRSRKSLWLKGETSGNYQHIRGIYYDCDADTLLLMVDPQGPACHTGQRTCFFRALGDDKKDGPGAQKGGPALIKELFDVIKSRKKAGADKSYVASLYAKGMPKILEKVREESGELMDAATSKDDKEVVHELSDLWFHTMVLLSQRGIEIEDVFNELGRRFGRSGIDEKNSRPKK